MVILTVQSLSPLIKGVVNFADELLPLHRWLIFEERSLFLTAKVEGFVKFPKVLITKLIWLLLDFTLSEMARSRVEL